MKIECIKEKIQRAVYLTEKITGKNLSLPVLANILIEARGKNLIIKSTNLDLGIEVKIPALVIEEGIVSIKPNIISAFLSNIKNEDKIKIELVNGNLLITTSNTSTIIKCDPADDFPNIPSVKDGKNIKLLGVELVAGLRAVNYASALSDIKPEISSVYIYLDNNNLVFVATDSFRLAEKKIKLNKNNEFEPVIIPSKNIGEIIRVFDNFNEEVSIYADKNQITFYSDNIYLTSRLIEGVYPDYRQIMPKDFKIRNIIKKDDLLQALKLSNIFVNRLNQITLIINSKDQTIEIKSINQDVGENDIKIKAEVVGEDLTVNFNAKYIIDSFQSINTEFVSLNLNEINKPLFISGYQDNLFAYIVMPLNR